MQLWTLLGTCYCIERKIDDVNKQTIFFMLLGVVLVVPKAGTASAEFTDDALREFHRFSQISYAKS